MTADEEPTDGEELPVVGARALMNEAAIKTANNALAPYRSSIRDVLANMTATSTRDASRQAKVALASLAGTARSLSPSVADVIGRSSAERAAFSVASGSAGVRLFDLDHDPAPR